MAFARNISTVGGVVKKSARTDGAFDGILERFRQQEILRPASSEFIISSGNAPVLMAFGV